MRNPAKRFLMFVASILWALPAAAQVAYTDVHVHLHGVIGRGQPDDFRGAARVAVKSMDQFGAQRMIVMPPPLAPDMPLFDADELFTATRILRGDLRLRAAVGRSIR
jgi:hypothetical protein